MSKTRTRASLPNAVIGVTAFEGAGKTRFACSGPKPTTLIGTDMNTKETVRETLKLGEDDVNLLMVEMPLLSFDDRDEIESGARETWTTIHSYLTPMLKDESSRPRVLALDTAKDIYNIRVMAEFGKTDQIPPGARQSMMGRCNTNYKSLIAGFKNRGVIVVLNHPAKELWVGKIQRTQNGNEEVRSKMTGLFDMERDGYKETGFITNVEVHLAFDPDKVDKHGAAVPLSSKFGMKIKRCTARPDLIGKEYWGREKLADGSRIARASIPFLMSQVYPQTTIADWSE